MNFNSTLAAALQPTSPQAVVAGSACSDWQPNFRCIRSLPDLAAVEPQWRRLCDRHGSAIEQFDWVQACAEMSAPLKIETVYDGQRLAAAAPLCVQTKRGISWRAMLGVDQFYEPMDLLADSSKSLQALAQLLAQDGSPLLVGRIPAGSLTIAALKDAFRGKAVIVEREEAGSPYLPLDDTWIDPEEHLSSRRRSDLRRARRRAEQLGKLTAHVITPEEYELPALLEEAFHVEQASWKGTANTSLAQDVARGSFFRRYAAGLCRQGQLRMSFLRLDGRPIAMQIAAVQSGRFYLLKIGYDAEFARCSPGMLLISESIGYAALAGLESYEFLGRPDAWIEVWTSQVRPCISLRIYPFSLQGRAALADDMIGRVAGKLREKRRHLVMGAKGTIRKCLDVVARRAAGGYIAGETLSAARHVQSQLQQQSLGTTIGFWDAEGDPPRQVADQYLAGLDLLGTQEEHGYLSIKLPSLQFSKELLREVADRARQVDRRLHFDALGPDAVDQTRTMIEDLRRALPDLRLSTTLPGRWLRSVDDADWAVEQGLAVRVVKGQWADPAHPTRDFRTGYLDVIDRLAGRARHVSVATHDLKLAAQALARLQARKTSCDLELLYGLPMRKSIQQARRLGLPIRIYIPYGAAYLPYAMSRLRKNPRLAWWLCKDFLSSLLMPHAAGRG